ncbi:MAG: flippase [Candidatus Geothermincolia bacterium]
MSNQALILRNSLFLTLQPLFMNIVSLLVTGYIARRIDTSDFGIFNFVVTYIMLFFPLAILGMNRVMIKDMAGSEGREKYAGKLLPLRFTATVLVGAAIVISAHLLGYPARVVAAIGVGSLIFLFQMFSETFSDIFHSYQRMEFTALIGLVAGMTLTILSAVAAYLGYGLFGILGAYVFGQMLGALLALTLLRKYFFRIRLRLDLKFCREKIVEGFPFFLMTMLWYAMMRVDTLVLSKKVGMDQIGLYTAAIMLVTKLSIIPQGISSAILPELSRLVSLDKKEEMAELVRKFMSKLLVFVLPGTILASAYAEVMMRIIFGEKYSGGSIILSIGIWAFLLRCLAFVEFSLLTALGMQKKMLGYYVVGFAYCIVANFLLIWKYGRLGAVFAYVTSQLLLTALFTARATKSVGPLFSAQQIAKIVTLNATLTVFLYLLRDANYVLGIASSLALYLAGALALRLVRVQEILHLKKMFSLAG